MVSSSGLVYTMTQAGFDFSKLLVLYDFQESGQILNKAPNYPTQFSGILSGPNTFYNSSGVAFPTTNIVSVQNTGDFYSTNWTHIFLISRSGGANDNFFSSLSAESGAISTGYLISSNNVGNLIFSYESCNGNQSITSDLILNNNSSFAITKRDDSLTFYQYTLDFDLMDSNVNQIIGEQIFQSNFADLFYSPHSQAGFIQDYYSGYVFAYLYFSDALSVNQLKSIFSGLYTTVTTSGGTPSSSGTDCSGFFAFSVPDAIIPVVTPPPNATLTQDGITLLRDFPSGSTVCIDYDTGNDGTSWNNDGLFDFLRDDFTTLYPTNIPPIVYFNGQRVISGLSRITGQYCQTGKVWDYDYAFTGNIQIDDADTYEIDDTLIYDIPITHTWQELHSGTGSVILSDTTRAIGYYLNGQRTKDFTISGSTLTPTLPLHSGDIVVIDYYNPGYGIIGEIHNSGYFFTSGMFGQGTSRVYLNGQRQVLGVDYLEITSNSLLMGTPIPQPLTVVADIEDYLLWNI